MRKLILILRPDNLGDFVLFSGALRHIRAAYPDARITLCVKRYVRNAVELCPYVDEIWEWESLVSPFGMLDGRRVRRARIWLEWRFRWLLTRIRRFDLVLLPLRSPTAGYWGMHQMVCELRANRKCGIAGDLANQTIEDDAAGASAYTERLTWPPGQWPMHALDVTREFLRFTAIEVAADELWPELWTSTSDKAWAESHVPSSGSATLLAICPGVTSNSGKSYPAQRYTETLASLLNRRFDVVVLGSPGETAMCGEVADAVGRCSNVGAVTNLAGQSSVRQTIECLKRCDAVLSVDTASAHIAVALRKPTVVILGGGQFGQFFPWGDSTIHRVAHVQMDCYGCGWKCAYGDFRCIQNLTPAAVAHELDVALENHKSKVALAVG